MTPLNLTIRNFDTFISTAGLALVHVQQGSLDSDLLQAIAQYFDQVYPDSLVYGSLARASVNITSWWKDRFSHSGEIRSVLDVETGFYLFRQGSLVCHHSGSSSNGTGAALAGLIGFAFDNQNLVEHAIGEVQRSNTDAVVGALEPHVKNFSRARSVQSALTAADNPYTVLGIASSASNDEVKKAYRAKLAANHPDRVALLSAEIKQVAGEQSRRITAAYESIVKMRGM